MLKICIDPGHGGKDPGATAQGVNEKDIVLNVSTILKQLLERQGLQVIMTRTNDTFVELKDRCNIANREKADVFVSIHCNSASSTQAHGFEIFHSIGSTKGNKLSADIKLSVNENKSLIRADRGIKPANFTVLTGTNMPAVLVELAFISNDADREILKTKQNEFAKAICKGICNYLGISNISNKGTDILSEPTVTIQQMKQWAKTRASNREFIDLAELYYHLSLERNINPAISYAQFAHETGFLYSIKSAAGLDASYHNPCGLKVPQGGGDYDKNAHMKFATWHDGISAHLDHLALYSGAKNYPKKDTLDPRHFQYLLGTAKTVESLSGKWAPSQSYGDKLKVYIKEMENIEVMENTQEPSTWAKETWEKATELGLIDGTRPKDNITRQEVAAVAVRLYEMLKQG
jgi:cell wall hydrolase/autolysin